MRIIAGTFRGRKLLPPESDTTRPITDRVKQSLFDILAPLMQGIVVYDCFAGTGSLGLESLSRGAKRAVFFEQDRSAGKRLRQNIDSLKLQNSSQIVSGDLFKWFETLGTRPAEAGRAGVVFLDPPYRMLREIPGELQSLSKLISEHHLSQDGIVVFRHDANDQLELPGLPRYDLREYGGMTLEFLRKTDE